MMFSIPAKIDGGTVIMVVAALLIAVYLYVLEKKPKKRANDLCKQYETLTAETLAAIPDEELVRAVAANLIAKQTIDHPDLFLQLMQLSFGRQSVYSVWLLCNELNRRDLYGYLRSPYRRFAQPAVAGFEEIGAPDCAAALQTALEAYADTPKKKDIPFAELTETFRAAVDREDPLSLCISYIRENIAEFTDC